MNQLSPEIMTAVQSGLLGVPKEDLRAWFAHHGESTQAADTLFRQVHRHSDYTRALFRPHLSAPKPPHRTGKPPTIAQEILHEANTSRGGALALDETLSSPDGTRKLLLATADGHRIESVLIPMDGHYTQCVSSQVGCRLGCTFCLTAKMGLVRNLTAAEIVGQVHWAIATHSQVLPVRNLVFMGMGEPLDNLTHVIAACKVLLDTDGLNFSARRITVSTAGILSKLRELVESVPVQVAVSLNAPTDEQRNQIMPINRRWPLADLRQCLKDIPLASRRRITMEYVLLSGLNDRLEDADNLVAFLEPLDQVKVNLIPWNPFPDSPWKRPDEAQVIQFRDRLLAGNISVTIRQSKGLDIGAACGQLDGEPVPPTSVPLANYQVQLRRKTASNFDDLSWLVFPSKKISDGK